MPSNSAADYRVTSLITVGYAEGRIHNYRYHSPVCFSKCFSFRCLFYFLLFLIAMEYAELQMLLLAEFSLIPGVKYSLPPCKNNLYIPFLSPAWDGSHFPRSLWFYHNCLPTYVLCLSYRVFLLQKSAKFSPAAEKWWSVQKSLCAELIASLPIHFRESQCPNLPWVIWGLICFSGCLQSVKMMACSVLPPPHPSCMSPHPGPHRLCQPSPSAEGAAALTRDQESSCSNQAGLQCQGMGKPCLCSKAHWGWMARKMQFPHKNVPKPRDTSLRSGGNFIGWPSMSQPHGGYKSWSWRVGWLTPLGKLSAFP